MPGAAGVAVAQLTNPAATRHQQTWIDVAAQQMVEHTVHDTDVVQHSHVHGSEQEQQQQQQSPAGPQALHEATDAHSMAHAVLGHTPRASDANSAVDTADTAMGSSSTTHGASGVTSAGGSSHNSGVGGSSIAGTNASSGSRNAAWQAQQLTLKDKMVSDLRSKNRLLADGLVALKAENGALAAKAQSNARQAEQHAGLVAKLKEVKGQLLAVQAEREGGEKQLQALKQKVSDS